MLKFKSLKDQTAEETELFANENLPIAESDGEINEPAWLRNSAIPCQTQDPNLVAEPTWLHRLELANTSANPALYLESPVSSDPSDTLAPEEFVSDLRSTLRVGEPVPNESSPEISAFPQNYPLFGGVQHSLKSHRLLIAISILCLTPFLCAVGWFGVANSSLLAATLSTPTPQEANTSGRLVWPATWTPLPSPTGTKTSTPTNTATATQTLKPTRVPPTRTPRPPSPTTSPYLFNSVQRGCQHSGGTYIEGVVSSLFGEVTGAHVSLGTSPGGNVIQTIVTGKDKSAGYYTFVIRADGPYPGTFYVWVTDTAGNPLSDPNGGRVVTNAIRNGDDPTACWQAYVDFVAVR